MKIVSVSLPNRSSLQTFWQSSMFSLAGRTEKEDTGKNKLDRSERTERANAYKGKTKEQKAALKTAFDAKRASAVKVEVATRARLVKLSLTGSQTKWMKRWFQDANATYNLVIKEILANKLYLPDAVRVLDSNSFKVLESDWQKRLVAHEGLSSLKNHWFRTRTPKVIRQQAVKEALAHLKGYKTLLEKHDVFSLKVPSTRKAKGPVPKFRPGFKSGKDNHGSISIEKVSFSLPEGEKTGRTFNLFRRTDVWAPFNPKQTQHFKPEPAERVYPRPREKMYVMRGIRLAGKEEKLPDCFLDSDKKIHEYVYVCVRMYELMRVCAS